jgi:uncharacterized membrane protein YhiD involved in acid resistance
MTLDWRNQPLRLVVVFVVVLITSGVLVYALLRMASTPTPQVRQAPTTAAPEASSTRSNQEIPFPINEPRREAPAPSPENNSLLARLFESQSAETIHPSEGWGMTLARITLRLLLAALLGAALAFRPRKNAFTARNPYVAQTQILLAIIASALMMIVGDNAARAFGIFAAVSLVRFRTNIRDPKEISVLLVSLGIGLATGVGRPDLALIVCLFVLAVLWILENLEARQVFRTMELKVVTKDIEATERVLGTVFRKNRFASELRALSHDGDEKAGTIIFTVDISSLVTTDRLSNEISTRDGGNVMSIEWEQKKTVLPYQ